VKPVSLVNLALGGLGKFGNWGGLGSWGLNTFEFGGKPEL
jgi:hypothetical protein